jgi:endoglucanase
MAIFSGKGPIIARGRTSFIVFDGLIAAAEKAKVDIRSVPSRRNARDANAIQLSRGGKAAGLVSIPLRYMHTPARVLSLKDLDSAVKLLTRCLDLQPGTDFTP